MHLLSPHQDPPLTIEVEVEPSYVGIGPYHVAVGMNNRAWFYLFGDNGPEQMKDSREYLGTVNKLYMNADYAAVSFEGKVQLHMVGFVLAFVQIRRCMMSVSQHLYHTSLFLNITVSN